MWATRREIIIKIYTHKILGPRQQYRPPYRKKDQALFSGWILEKSTTVNTHTVCMSWTRVWLAADLGFKLLFLKYISTDKLRNRMVKTHCVKKTANINLKRRCHKISFKIFLFFNWLNLKTDIAHFLIFCGIRWVLNFEFDSAIWDTSYVLCGGPDMWPFTWPFTCRRVFWKYFPKLHFLVLRNRKGCWKPYNPEFFKDSWTSWISNSSLTTVHETKA